jgi:hypothetical protein
MTDVTLVHSHTNTGSGTTVTPGSITTATGNLVILLVFASVQTSFTTPTNWIKIESQEQQSPLNEAMFALFNPASGAKNPSVTITSGSWHAAILEFSATGAQAGTVLSHSEEESNQTFYDSCMRLKANLSIPNILWIHAVNTVSGVVGAFTHTPATIWNALTEITGQSMLTDIFWASTLNNGPWPCVTTATNYVSAPSSGQQISAAFTTSANQGTLGSDLGSVVENAYSGMIGG